MHPSIRIDKGPTRDRRSIRGIGGTKDAAAAGGEGRRGAGERPHCERRRAARRVQHRRRGVAEPDRREVVLARGDTREEAATDGLHLSSVGAGFTPRVSR